MATHGPLDRPNRWSTWWVLLWVVVVVGLLGAIVLEVEALPWLIAAAIFFGVPEGIGMLKPHDPYPPLTQVIRQYVPRWLAFTVIYGFVGLAAGTWFGFDHRWGLAAITGLLGWLTTHFDLTFDHPAAEDEHLKYKWYAEKVGLPKVSTWLDARREPAVPEPAVPDPPVP